MYQKSTYAELVHVRLEQTIRILRADPGRIVLNAILGTNFQEVQADVRDKSTV